MSTNDFRLSSALVLKLREYKFSNDQMISFVSALNHYVDINRLSELMKKDDQITFNYDIDTKIFELLDPSGLMGNINKVIKLNNFLL